ncbi:short chain dehydrogenase [Alsobacter soli]|uniref:Short chain dehydrogenase n=1 Tax=Alsobacter soli TaxID=2109933 RepID=A0A2T1HT60_9HYPH|nr:glucose 1-dehydrogenase [Alsobacter soli]PSC04843.1 short chain dehydrogenase [Alsobacter soli]
MRLQDKVAIVTGGGSGFGAGIVQAFVEEGATVMVVDRDGAAAQRVAEPLGAKARPFTGDVSKSAEVEAMVDAAQREYGRLDIVVNNAGVAHLPAPMETIDEEAFDRIAAVNMRGIYLAARYAVPVFKAAEKGVFLNIASTGGVSPRPNLTWYNASKAWAIGATRAMAVELAPLGIRVNAINPVAGDTPLLPTFMGGDTDEHRKRFISVIPMGRLSTPRDIAMAAVYLCSDEASLVTGVALEVDGGRCL